MTIIANEKKKKNSAKQIKDAAHALVLETACYLKMFELEGTTETNGKNNRIPKSQAYQGLGTRVIEYEERIIDAKKETCKPSKMKLIELHEVLVLEVERKKCTRDATRQ